MTVTILRDGVLIEMSDAEYAALNPPAPILPPVAQTVWAPKDLIERLFTPSEQEAFFTSSDWRVRKFITLVTAMQQIDITDPEFTADISAVVTMGLLTGDRAQQILSGSPAQ
jgi:hypothetical protein